MFILPEAMQARGKEIAKGWAGSLTMGAGQFCTNPGIALVLRNENTDAFIETATAELSTIAEQTMLTAGIAGAFNQGAARMAETAKVCLKAKEPKGRATQPHLFVASAQEWLSNKDLHEEVFGPLGLIVVTENLDEMYSVAKSLEGQLTCTLHLDPADKNVAAGLLPILEHKAGRVLANGFPTGVEVCDSMVHGGPYPASTNFGATSVGTMSIRRWLRPVCYQNMPTEILPDDFISDLKAQNSVSS